MAQARQLTAGELSAMNMQARNIVLGGSLKMTQQIFSQAVTPVAATPTVVNVAPRNVGLIQGFIVQINGNILNNGMTTDLTRTSFGNLNAVSNFQFQDLNNTVRINTSGRHLGTLNTEKQGFGFGGAYAPNLPNEIGQNAFTVQTAPVTIAAGANSNIQTIYYVPIAYSSTDLRGAIWANVVNATMNLQITLNGTPVAASGDPLNKMYIGNTGIWNGNVTVTVYQVFRDQLQKDKNGMPILPFADLSKFYELIETTLTGVTAAADFPYNFANFRTFQGATVWYDNNGVFNPGTDINYFSLLAANSLQVFKYTPAIAALNARTAIMGDLTDGTYYFDFRDNPINTQVFGNMQLNVNAITATSASMVVGTEAFGDIALAAQGSSLDAG